MCTLMRCEMKSKTLLETAFGRPRSVPALLWRGSLPRVNPPKLIVCIFQIIYCKLVFFFFFSFVVECCTSKNVIYPD